MDLENIVGKEIYAKKVNRLYGNSSKFSNYGDLSINYFNWVEPNYAVAEHDADVQGQIRDKISELMPQGTLANFYAEKDSEGYRVKITEKMLYGQSSTNFSLKYMPPGLFDYIFSANVPVRYTKNL